MIPSIQSLKVGDKVHYQPDHYAAENKWENGIVKEIRNNEPNAVWVVYNCNNEWYRYQDYTSAKTNLKDLGFGWIQ